MLGSTNIVAFVPTRDSEKAKAFYEGVLEPRFVSDDGFALVFDANGIMVRVAKVPPQFTPAQFTILGWQVTEIENVVAGLYAEGGQFERDGVFFQDELRMLAPFPRGKVGGFEGPPGDGLSVSPPILN